MQKAEVNVLRMHADSDGHVWFGDDTCRGVNSGQTVAEFFDGDYVDLNAVRYIHVIGCAANAAIITRLAKFRSCHPETRKFQHIRLVSPAICTAAELESPDSVLQRLWQPSSLDLLHGRWHEMGEKEFVTYALAEGLRKDPTLKGTAGFAFRHHPARLAYLFIPHLDATACAHLITTIMDPRWFIHPKRPHRLSKLYAYLGLVPENAALILGEGEPGRHHDRARLSIKSWYNHESLYAVRNFGLNDPPFFLWRIMQAHAKKHCNGPAAVLAATRRCVAFIHAVWLNALVATPHPEVAFRPAAFFKDEREVHAYEAHAAKIKN